RHLRRPAPAVPVDPRPAADCDRLRAGVLRPAPAPGLAGAGGGAHPRRAHAAVRRLRRPAGDGAVDPRAELGPAAGPGAGPAPENGPLRHAQRAVVYLDDPVRRPGGAAVAEQDVAVVQAARAGLRRAGWAGAGLGADAVGADGEEALDGL